ncbi:MAG TPA: MFS transporter [Gaiellaceae bacterium]|nr:MFS transporter [Gaiellaceae bacterium]
MAATRSPRTVLASAAAAQVAVSFINFGLPSIGPDLRRHFGLSLPELGAVLTATLLGSGVVLIGAGVAVDRWGARRATLVGTAVAAAGLAAASAAESKAVLFVSLVASGMGSSVIPIAGAGALFRVYPAAQRGWALGVRQMAVPLGGTIAAGAMPGLVELGGVELAFAVAAGAVAVTGTIFALIPEEGSGPMRAKVERAFRSIVTAPGMLRLFVVSALYIVVLQAILSYTVPAARAAGLSAFWAGFTYFAFNVTAMVARLVWGRVADRQGGSRRVRTLVETGVVGAVGGLLFTLALHGGAALVIPAAILFGFGALGWNALVYVVAGERTPPELAGRSVATAATVVFLISAACTPPLGALADHAGWDAFWGTTAALSALGALAAIGLRPKAPPDLQSPDARTGRGAVAWPRRSSRRR